MPVAAPHCTPEWKITEAGAHRQKWPAAGCGACHGGLMPLAPRAAAGPVDLKNFGLFGLLELLLYRCDSVELLELDGRRGRGPAVVLALAPAPLAGEAIG